MSSAIAHSSATGGDAMQRLMIPWSLVRIQAGPSRQPCRGVGIRGGRPALRFRSGWTNKGYADRDGQGRDRRVRGRCGTCGAGGLGSRFGRSASPDRSRLGWLPLHRAALAQVLAESARCRLSRMGAHAPARYVPLHSRSAEGAHGPTKISSRDIYQVTGAHGCVAAGPAVSVSTFG